MIRGTDQDLHLRSICNHANAQTKARRIQVDGLYSVMRMLVRRDDGKATRTVSYSQPQGLPGGS